MRSTDASKYGDLVGMGRPTRPSMETWWEWGRPTQQSIEELMGLKSDVLAFLYVRLVFRYYSSTGVDIEYYLLHENQNTKTRINQSIEPLTAAILHNF